MASVLTVGKLSAKTGVSRKALRVYEAAGILMPATRTPAGYRVYHTDAVAVVEFIARARRLGFSVAEIQRIVSLRRAGQAPCIHVQRLAREKIATLDALLRDLRAMRRGLAVLVARRPSARRGAVCPHIEAFTPPRRNGHGPGEDVALPAVHQLPRGRGRRRRSPDR
jgi:DNA-binding transcriptional MerR regulator